MCSQLLGIWGGILVGWVGDGYHACDVASLFSDKVNVSTE